MIKTLIAISSCQLYEDRGLNQPLRDTWLPGLAKINWNYKFFHGNGATPKDDVVLVGCDDGYGALTDKTKLKTQYALDNGYDFIFCAFPDTYACPERLFTCGFEAHDYFGSVYQHLGGHKYCQGGSGFFLSKKAMEILVKDSSSYPNEDCWCSDVLFRHGIYPVDHKGFKPFGPGPLRSNDSITNHLSTQPGGYTGENMRQEHKRWLESL